MKNYLLISILLILILSTFSCIKEDNSKIEIYRNTELRSPITIGSKSISWLDSFRINLFENRHKNYIINDAISGIDIILNLYKTQGLGSFIQYDILKKDYVIPLTPSGSINTSSLRSFFEEVHQNNGSQYLNSRLENKALGGITIEIKSQTQTELHVSVTSVIGANDPQDTTSLILDDDYGCFSKFSSNSCFKAGFGDSDYYKLSTGTTFSYGRQLEGGGKCNGTLVGKTAAHEEIQKKFTSQIPKIVNVKSGKFLNTHIVKFVNQECKFIAITRKIDEYNNYLGCSNDLMKDYTLSTIFPTTIYNNNALNCSYCIINNWVKSVIPSGLQLSHMNIWTDFSPGFNSDTEWFVEICWGEPVLVPIVVLGPISGPSPTEVSNENIIGSDPYYKLDKDIFSIIN